MVTSLQSKSAEAPPLGCAAPGAWTSKPRAAASGSSSSTPQACAVVPGTNDHCPVWTASYDNPTADSAANQLAGDDEPHGFRIAGDRFYIAGNSRDSTNTRYEMFIAAYDRSTGAQRWAQRWHDPDGDSDTAWNVATSPSGDRAFITGQRCVSGYCFVETVAYDSAGNQLWSTSYHDAGGGNDLTGSIAVSADGSRVFVAGGQQPDWNRGSSVAQYVTIAYDAATGVQQWLQTYQGPLRADGNNLSQVRRLAVAPDGQAVYAGGLASASDSQIDTFTVIAYDPVTGSQLWRSDYAHQNVDALDDMVLTPDGSRLYLAGLDRTCNGPCSVATDSYATVALDAGSGAQLWSNVASDIGDVNRMALSPDGTTVYVTGVGYAQTDNNYQAATVAVNTVDGSQRWLVDTLAAGGDGWANDVTATTTAAVIAVVSEFGGAAYQTVALDELTGQKAWSALYSPDPGNDVDNPWFVRATADGWVLVAGLLGQEVDPANGASNDIDAFAFAYQVSAPAVDTPEALPGAGALLGAGFIAAVMAFSRRRPRHGG
ncbi:MAG: hypothetical protein ABR498_01285 [Candidatus Dormibacteria bacterium]